jgi:hypothetical protein
MRNSFCLSEFDVTAMTQRFIVSHDWRLPKAMCKPWSRSNLSWSPFIGIGDN